MEGRCRDWRMPVPQRPNLHGYGRRGRRPSKGKIIKNTLWKN